MGQATREQRAKERLRIAEAELVKAAEDARKKHLVSLQYSDGPLGEGNWVPTGWWRVVNRDGQIWCETGNQQEALDSMQPGHILYELYEKKQTQWKYLSHKESE